METARSIRLSWGRLCGHWGRIRRRLSWRKWLKRSTLMVSSRFYDFGIVIGREKPHVIPYSFSLKGVFTLMSAQDICVQDIRVQSPDFPVHVPALFVTSTTISHPTRTTESATIDEFIRSSFSHSGLWSNFSRLVKLVLYLSEFERISLNEISFWTALLKENNFRKKKKKDGFATQLDQINMLKGKLNQSDLKWFANRNQW